MDEDLSHAQGAGNCTCVLRARSAEGHQQVVTWVVSFGGGDAAGDGDAANGSHHIGVGDFQKALGQLSRCMVEGPIMPRGPINS